MSLSPGLTFSSLPRPRDKCQPIRVPKTGNPPHPNFYYDLQPYLTWAWHSALNRCDGQRESSRLSLNKALCFYIRGGFSGALQSEHNIGVCVCVCVCVCVFMVAVVGLTCVWRPKVKFWFPRCFLPLLFETVSHCPGACQID